MYKDYVTKTAEQYNQDFQSLQKRYYGLTPSMSLPLLVKEVCDCLGHGANNKAVNLVLETIAQETHLGLYKDPTILAGMGLAQFDKLPFDDTKDRASTSDKAKLYDTFGIALDLVEWEHLRYNPLLSIIFCRLKYKLVKDSIPNSLEDRAVYYKKWYNSYLGKATPEEYIKNAKRFGLV